MKHRSSQSIGLRGAYRRARVPLKVRMKVKGRVEAMIVNPDGQIAQKVEGDNLVLNQGLDGIATRKWCDTFLYCAAGSNGTPTSDSSGATQASQSGTTVTLTGGAVVFADPADIGKVIKWNSGPTARIVSITSTTSAEVDETQTVASGLFTIYRTNQTSLGTEIQRTNNYLTGIANCGTSRSGNVFSHKRTFDFPVESGSVTYREIGFSHASGAGANLFSRIKLSTDLTLVASQVLRVVYTLQLTVSPDTPVGKAANILGWPIAPSTTVDGDEQIQYFGLSGVNTSGATVALDDGGYVNEPSEETTAYAFLSTVTTSPAAFGSATNRTGTTPAQQVVELDDYVSLSYSIDKVTTFDVDEALSTVWRTIGLGRKESSFESYVSNTFVFVFDQNQTKDELHTLELRFTYTWNREL